MRRLNKLHYTFCTSCSRFLFNKAFRSVEVITKGEIRLESPRLKKSSYQSLACEKWLHENTLMKTKLPSYIWINNAASEALLGKRNVPVATFIRYFTTNTETPKLPSNKTTNAESPKLPPNKTTNAETPKLPPNKTVNLENPQLPPKKTTTAENPKSPTNKTTAAENPKMPPNKTTTAENPKLPPNKTTNADNSALPPKKSSDTAGKSPITWKLIAAVVGVAGGLLLWMQSLKKEKKIEQGRQRYIGKAKLGGDWSLTDHFGMERSNKDFHGQWMLIYFGFTHCPDVCPAEIEKIVSVIKKTDDSKSLPKIQPILISVDPERDTPTALKEYCGEFSPRLLGFTGTAEQVLTATRAYRVYFSAGPKDEDSDYIVDHSIISYLVNPKGEFVDFFGQDKTVDQMYDQIKRHVTKYQAEESKSKS